MKNKIVSLIAGFGVVFLSVGMLVGAASTPRASVFNQSVVDDIVADLHQREQFARVLQSVFMFEPQAALYFKGKGDQCAEEILVLDSQYNLTRR